jgi:hypothetical protein
MATRSYEGSGQGFNGAKEQAEQVAEGVMGRVRAAGGAVQSQAEHAVADYPISTVLAVFGIGLGVGVVLGSTMFSSSSSCSTSSGWLPSGASNWIPAMSSNSSSWLPSGSSNSWFGNANSASNWGEGLVKSAKNMCGY